MLRFIHAADLHLDAPFAALSPEQARGRRAEQRQLLSRLAALCEEEKAEVLLLSGTCWTGSGCTMRPPRPWPRLWAA